MDQRPKEWRQAMLAHQAGRPAEAEALLRRLLKAHPNDGDALNQLALLLVQQRPAEALPLFRQATMAAPNRPDFWINYAESLRRSGAVDDAVAAGRRAVGLDPRQANGWYNLGCALRDAELFDDAVSAYRQAVALKPDYARAHHNLANLLRREGKTPVAVEHFRKAAAADPNWWEPQYNLAATLLESGDAEAAVAALEKVRSRVPPTAEVDPDSLMADVRLKQGLIEEVKAATRRAWTRRPPDDLQRLRYELLTPPIPPDEDAVDRLRDHAAATLRRFGDAPPVFDLAKLHSSGAEPPMAWTYHGRDDRPLKEAYAQLFLDRLNPVPLADRAKGKTPHVGFVVTNGHEGVYDRCLGGLADRLARRGRLRISLVSTRAGLNVMNVLRPTFAGGKIIVPERIDQAAAALAASDVDILHYWEIGTDSFNYFLPFLKPAPLQFAGWGWPSTVGHDRVDGYLGSELLEPADGDSHYTERLHRLRTLPTWYERPPAPTGAVDRAAFGLTPDDRVALCAQNLRKLQPSFDPLLMDILERDDRALLLFLADEQRTITEQFKARLLRSASPTAAGRIRIVPRLPREDYLRLAATADVLLDPPGYGGGANTSFDAAAVATPVVTWAGTYHRGRWQAAVNRRLGATELNVDSATSYAETIAAILADRDRRRDLSDRIRTHAVDLFEDEAAVSAYQEFFLKQCEK
ncbi:MAG: tetratricopeptide repeat protein [Planctomycetia bacterium]